MSSNSLNLYVIKNVKGLNSFETLCNTMFSPNKKNKLSQKQQLAYLREMSMYMSVVTSMDESIFSAIVVFMKDLGEQDFDRKIFRACMYLLSEAITEYSSRIELTKKRSLVTLLNNLFIKEITQRTGIRQLLTWRTLGSVVFAHNAQTNKTAIVTKAYSNNVSTIERENSNILVLTKTEFEDQAFNMLHSTLESLQFPVKQKKTRLFGEDKEYFPKMLQWSAIMSALARSGKPLPRKCWENMSFGLGSLSYVPLAQHSFRVLLLTVMDMKLELQQREILSILSDRLIRGKEYLNTFDPLCCTYYIRALSALAKNCKDFSNAEHETVVSTTSTNTDVRNQQLSDVGSKLLTLFKESLRFLKTAR